MNTTFFYFLIESSIYLFFFLAIYRLAISNLTHFNWMRGYLLSSITLSIILPLIKIPGQWFHSILGNALIDNPLSLTILNPLMVLTPKTIESGMQTSSPLNSWASLMFVLSAIYFIGAFYKSIALFRNLLKIRESIRNNSRHKEGKYWTVNTDNKVVAFSFFNFIFINGDLKNLTSQEIQQIKNHEYIHANQLHTIDILFIEIVGILFWFNPLVRYAKTKLQEIHEYIADEKTAGHGEMKKCYAQLLFNLASDTKAFCLSTGFSGKQINNRILMVSKARSLPGYRLVFISLIPIAAFLMLSFSYLDNTFAAAPTNTQNTEINSSPKIGKINWVNNTIINTDGLNKILGLKTGDEYIKKNFENRIWFDMDGIFTFYLDKGYVFSKMDISENQTKEGAVDLTITIYEGGLGKIGKVSVRGNKQVSTDDILSKISVKPGDLFNKTKIVESIRALSKMGKFDNEKIKPEITPKPDESNNDFAIIDIAFEVTEK
jgi:beta-lactamase regulating signal transducer with metallopeptidase domain